LKAFEAKFMEQRANEHLMRAGIEIATEAGKNLIALLIAYWLAPISHLNHHAMNRTM